jgi:hypothetical protein
VCIAQASSVENVTPGAVFMLQRAVDRWLDAVAELAATFLPVHCLLIFLRHLFKTFPIVYAAMCKYLKQISAGESLWKDSAPSVYHISHHQVCIC